MSRLNLILCVRPASADGSIPLYLCPSRCVPDHRVYNIITNRFELDQLDVWWTQIEQSRFNRICFLHPLSWTCLTRFCLFCQVESSRHNSTLFSPESRVPVILCLHFSILAFTVATWFFDPTNRVELYLKFSMSENSSWTGSTGWMSRRPIHSLYL